MRKQHQRKKRRLAPKTVLRLPDLDQAKSAVLNSRTSADVQRGYRHAIDEFVEWYCSEPRLSFNRAVILRYQIHLESRKLAPGAVNIRLGAVRRLAYDASDCGLLSADLTAGIRRVRGVKKIGVRLGNWLLPDQAMALLDAPDPETMKGKRDQPLLAILVACGLRRHEAVELNVPDLQQREDHWAIVDLIGKAPHIRTIPAPDRVKDLIDDWLQSAGISSGRIFRYPNRSRNVKPVQARNGRIADKQDTVLNTRRSLLRLALYGHVNFVSTGPCKHVEAIF